MTRWKRFRDRASAVVGPLLLVLMVVTDSVRLYRSALWGTSAWLWAALAGTSVGLVGVVMAGVAIRRRTRSGDTDRGFPVLGLSYTAVIVVAFFITHHKYGSQPRVDTPLMVGALTAQVVLAVAILAFLPVLARPGFGQRTWPKDGGSAAGEHFRPAKPEDVRRSRALPSRRYHRRRR